MALLRSSKGQRRRSSTTPTSSGTRAATCAGSPTGSRRTTCTRTRKNLRTLAQARRREGRSRTSKPAWKFAPDAPLEQRPEGGTIVVPYLANKITYAYDRKTNTYLRSVTGEGKQVDAGAEEVRIAPKNVVVMVVAFVPLNAATRSTGSTAEVKGTGTAWISTNGKTIKGEWRKKTFDGPDPVLRQGRQAGHAHRRPDVHPGGPRGHQDTIKHGKVPAREHRRPRQPSARRSRRRRGAAAARR